MLDETRLISDRVGRIDVSGIRKAFELGASLEDPINLSIGQPDFKVPDEIKRAAIEAIEQDRNGYTLTKGDPALLGVIRDHLRADIGWNCDGDELDVMVTSGTSGGLILSFMAMLDPGDEAVISDPCFVIYPTLGPMTNSTMVSCNTYPDFRMTAERVEPCLTDKTKIVLINSPSNPTGVVLNDQEMNDLADLCTDRGVMLVSDEIYNLFTWPEGLDDAGLCPTPARRTSNMLLIRGYGKTYGCTGWRLGYAAGPSWLIREMSKLQQYSFVCAPSMAQAGVMGAFDVDMSEAIENFQRRSSRIHEAFDGLASVAQMGGAFYAFVEVPPHLGCTATEFSEAAIEQNVIIIPGNVFSSRDTHFRISYAVPDETLEEGLAVLAGMMRRT